MKNKTWMLFVLVLYSSLVQSQEARLFFTNSGTITFKSEASQELIDASSDHLRGIIDPEKRTFVFQVLMRTFEGFNSPLQQEHFNEKYLESEKYPEATFKGKIIEDIDLSVDSNYSVRAKGKLKIHGVEVERIIKAEVVVKRGVIEIRSDFSVKLSDHNIKIPKVVHEKVANEISVKLNTILERKIVAKN